MTRSRPAAGDYAPYAEQYIVLVSGDDILGALGNQLKQTTTLFSGRSERDGNFRYAPGKWTVKEVLGHVNDTERIMSYRALRIARGDQTPIEGFEQDDYIRNGPYADLRLVDLLEEFKNIRAATLRLFRNLRPEDWTRRGIANDNEISVRALAYVIGGHELHHRNLLEERYFKEGAVKEEIA